MLILDYVCTLLLLFYFGGVDCKRHQWSLFRVTKDKGVFSTPLDVVGSQSHVLPYTYSRTIDFNDSKSSSSPTAGSRGRSAAASVSAVQSDLSADNIFTDEHNVYAVVREEIFSGTPDLYVSRKPSCTSADNSADQKLHFRPMYSNLALVSSSNSDLMPPKCRWKCGWGPFNVAPADDSSVVARPSPAITSPDQGRLYFVVAGMFGSSHDLHHEVHLRRLRSDCRRVLNAKSRRGSEPRDFEVLNCSELISVVSKGRPATSAGRPAKAVTWSGSSLVIIPGTSKHFIFQVSQSYV